MASWLGSHGASAVLHRRHRRAHSTSLWRSTWHSHLKATRASKGQGRWIRTTATRATSHPIRSQVAGNPVSRTAKEPIRASRATSIAAKARRARAASKAAARAAHVGNHNKAVHAARHSKANGTTIRIRATTKAIVNPGRRVAAPANSIRRLDAKATRTNKNQTGTNKERITNAREVVRGWRVVRGDGAPAPWATRSGHLPRSGIGRGCARRALATATRLRAALRPVRCEYACARRVSR